VIIERSEGKMTMRDTSTQLDENGHMNTFFVYRSTPTTKSPIEKSIFDIIGDSMGIKTDNNGKMINKEVLIENNITVEVLVGKIGVSITDFYVANILTTFDDLVEIGFKLTDLTLDRDYFSCDVLKTLYRVNCNDMKARWNITFDLETLMLGHFYTGELYALDFSIDSLIMSGGIARAQLRNLNYSVEGLKSIGFTKTHLDKLGIKAKRATISQPN